MRRRDAEKCAPVPADAAHHEAARDRDFEPIDAEGPSPFVSTTGHEAL